MIESANKQFNIMKPHPLLCGLVSFYNIGLPAAGMFSDRYTLMPGGSGTLSVAYDGGEVRADLWGTAVSANHIGREPSNYQCLLLVELHPCGLYQLTGFDQAELADNRISLKSIAPALDTQLCHAMESARTPAELTVLLDHIFLCFCEEDRRSDALVYAAEKIKRSRGLLQVNEIVDMVNYSQRQLNRIFYHQIGVGIKTFSRLIRFQHVLQGVQDPSVSLTALSHQTGYYDQAHFIKDFKRMSGMTPELYRKNMSDFYYESPSL